MTENATRTEVENTAAENNAAENNAAENAESLLQIRFVPEFKAAAAARRLNDRGVPAWVMGDVVAATEPDTDSPDYVQGAKGVNGGAVRLFGQYA